METKYFSTKKASDYLKSIGIVFSPGTLEVWRSIGRGPRFKKVAHKVFYSKTDLDNFANGKSVETVDSISQNSGA